MAEPRRALRGRFLRRQICDSKTVAELIDKRGPWAGLLFERLILWGDDDGRLVAEPQVVKAHCLPWHDRPARQVQADLQEMHRLGLIVLYENAGTQYAYFPNWHKHQPVQRSDRRIPSEFPAPPVIPADRRSDSQSDIQTGRQEGGILAGSSASVRCAEDEEEGEVEGEAEEEGGCAAVRSAARRPRSSPTPTAAAKPPQPPGPAPRQARSRSPAGCSWCLNPTDVADESIAGTQRLMQAYHDAYREQHGECPVMVEADWAALKRLLRGKSFERLAAVIRHGVLSEDPLIVRNGHRLAIILSNYQGIAEALDGGETHGVYGAHRRPSGRVTPAPPESFGAGGATEF